MEWIQAFDEAAVLFIYNNIQGGPFDAVMTLITKLGDKGMLWIVLTAVMLMISVKKKDMRGMAFGCAVALILSAVMCNIIIKPAVMRIRPYDLLGLEIMVDRLGDYSFPSGHTTAAFAFAAAVWLKDRRSGMAAVTAAAIMGVTRLYLCVHFPTDVLAGAVLGWGCAVVAVKLVDIFIKDRKKERASG